MVTDLGPHGRDLIASMRRALPDHLAFDERDELLLERAGRLRDRMAKVEATLAGLADEVTTPLHLRLLSELLQSEAQLARLVGQVDLHGDARPQTAISAGQRWRVERRWAAAGPSRRQARGAS